MISFLRRQRGFPDLMRDVFDRVDKAFLEAGLDLDSGFAFGLGVGKESAVVGGVDGLTLVLVLELGLDLAIVGSMEGRGKDAGICIRVEVGRLDWLIDWPIDWMLRSEE